MHTHTHTHTHTRSQTHTHTHTHIHTHTHTHIHTHTRIHRHTHTHTHVTSPNNILTGEIDSVINVQWGESTASNLLLKNRDVQYKSYPTLDHEIGQEQV